MTKLSQARAVTHVLALVVTTILLFTHCTDRSRNNPLDPKNTTTLGHPNPPFLLSFRDSVFVAWQTYAFDDLVGYNIYRRLAGETSYSLLGSVPAGQNNLWDTSAEYDRWRFYKVSASTLDYESPRSDSTEIRPGPSYVWAADAENGYVIKYTHDGLHEIFRTSVAIRPTKIAVNLKSRTTWVLDFWTDEILGLDRNGNYLGSPIAENGAYDVAVDSADNSFWVLNRDAGRVRKYDSAGRILFERNGFKRPIAMSLDTRKRQLWLLDKDAGEIVSINTFGDILRRLPGFPAAADLAINPTAGDLWIADSTVVVKIATDDPSRQTTVAGFLYAARLAVDEQRGVCWVIDSPPPNYASKVVQIAEDGTINFSVPGFDDARALAIVHLNGNCFVAEGLGRSLAQISKDGQLVSRKATDGVLLDVKVENLRP